MATSRTKDARPRTAILWCYNQVRAHLESGAPAGADGHRPKAAGVSLGTVALMIVTTCAVAWWVSIGWVPAYLALMVLIFVTPEGRRPRASARASASLSEPLEKSDGDASPDDRPILRAEAAHLGDQHPHLGLALAAGEEADASAMPPEDFQPGLANQASTAKPRRGRGRGRKTAKTAKAAAAEPCLKRVRSPGSAWVQVSLSGPMFMLKPSSFRLFPKRSRRPSIPCWIRRPRSRCCPTNCRRSPMTRWWSNRLSMRRRSQPARGEDVLSRLPTVPLDR